MNLLIVGAGAVGLGLASCLVEPVPGARRVVLLARHSTARALRERGLRRTGIFGERSIPPDRLDVAESFEEAFARGPFDHVLVCVKSFDSAHVAGRLAAEWSAAGGAPSGLRVVLFQNGWGNREVFATAFERVPGDTPPIYVARVITGFRRPSPEHVDVTVHARDVAVGSLAGEPLEAVEPLCRAIAAGGLPCIATPTVARDIWAKILYNCALNPLGAILGASYGELAEDPDSRAVMDRVIDEVFAVMRAEGHETHWSDADAYRAEFYGRLVPPTAAHHSSTLQDMRAGRRTEIDALSGEIARIGERRGIPVPVNASLYRIVRAMERARAEDRVEAR